MTNEHELLLQCTCGSLDHVVKFYRYEGRPHLEVAVSARRNIWYRLWVALKYVFLAEPNSSVEVIIRDEDLGRISEWLEIDRAVCCRNNELCVNGLIRALVAGPCGDYYILSGKDYAAITAAVRSSSTESE